MDGALTIDPTLIDWHGRDGLDYKAVWRAKWSPRAVVLALLGLALLIVGFALSAAVLVGCGIAVASVSVALPQERTLVFKPRFRSLRDIIVFASGKSNYLISKVLNQFWNATAYSFPATDYFALWTATLSATSTGATAGEASYTGYARVAMTANTTNFPSSSGGAAINNATAITFAANGGTLQTATYVGVLDSATTGAGNMLYWGSITSTAINPGDTPQINTSALTASEA